MKTESFRFSPTSAGVRIEHLDLQNSHNNYSKNYCNNNKSTSTNDPVIIPRARATKIPEEGEDLSHIIVQNGTQSNTEGGGNNRKRRSNKMRNCIIIGAVTDIISLLSFALLVECRSLKGSSSKKSYDEEKEIAHESRIQEATLEPDAESSEEVPTKVVSTTAYSKDPSTSTTQKHSSKRIVTASTGSGRLTRSRVSVICKGGYLGNDDDDGDDEQEISSTSTTSTSTSPFSTKRERRRKLDKELELPTLLPRETDWDDEEENAAEETESDEDDSTTLNDEETKQVVTVTGYSHVTGGKPETKALKRATSTTIQYVPKPESEGSSFAGNGEAEKTRKLINEDDIEGSSSSEEGVVITVRPKSKSSHHKSKPKASSISHSSHTVSTAPASSTSAQAPSSKSSHHSKKEKHHRKRDHSSEENEEEKEEEIAHRSSKRTKTSKLSGNNQSKPSSSSNNDKNEKGDSGEIEEDALFPTLRKSKTESKRGNKKASERRQKPAEVVPVSDPDLESAEAEPVAVVQVRKSENSSKKTSRSRSTSSTSSKSSDNRKEASSLKPVSVKDDSSEEYNMEEMPFITPQENAKRGKTRRSSSSHNHGSSKSSNSRQSRMSSKTAAPKLRTRTFSSAEIED